MNSVYHGMRHTPENWQLRTQVKVDLLPHENAISMPTCCKYAEKYTDERRALLTQDGTTKSRNLILDKPGQMIMIWWQNEYQDERMFWCWAGK